MRTDIILEYCNGRKPKDIKDRASKKTLYYYYRIYREMKATVTSDAFVNELIRVLVSLRVKSQGHSRSS